MSGTPPGDGAAALPDWASGPPAGGLADLLPAVARSLGHPGRPGPGLGLPPARCVVVVLVDGLGEHLLHTRGGHTPYLRRLRQESPATLLTGFPSTTATSMAMIGTGTLPGAHGLVGLDVLDPDRGVLFNELAWDAAVDPHRWQPHRTVLEDLAADGVDVVRVGPAYFDGSGLTEAALRGGRFVAAKELPDRVDATVAAARRGGPTLVYLYWGEVDKTAHTHGCSSWELGEELAGTDAELARLTRLLPADTLVVTTADHGMVDVPFEHRWDLAAEPGLAAGVRHVGGEPRALMLYCEPGREQAVARAWADRLAGHAEVVPRERAVQEGWFGPVSPTVLDRIGQVLVVMTGRRAVVDSRTARPQLLRLVGLHGARTAAETLVPLLVTTGGAARRRGRRR